MEAVLFLCVANALQRFSIECLDLYVSHGVFSRGIDMIADKYTTIYCSNSYSDICHPQVKQFDITESFFLILANDFLIFIL